MRVLGRAGVLRKRALTGDLPVVWCGRSFPFLPSFLFFFF